MYYHVLESLTLVIKHQFIIQALGLPLNDNRYSLSRALPRKRKRRVLYL